MSCLNHALSTIRNIVMKLNEKSANNFSTPPEFSDAIRLANIIVTNSINKSPSVAILKNSYNINQLLKIIEDDIPGFFDVYFQKKPKEAIILLLIMLKYKGHELPVNFNSPIWYSYYYGTPLVHFAIIHDIYPPENSELWKKSDTNHNTTAHVAAYINKLHLPYSSWVWGIKRKKDGNTPAHIAAQLHIDFKPPADSNLWFYKNKRGDTPAHYKIFFYDFDFLPPESNVWNIKNKRGVTPKMLIQELKRGTVMKNPKNPEQ